MHMYDWSITKTYSCAHFDVTGKKYHCILKTFPSHLKQSMLAFDVCLCVYTCLCAYACMWLNLSSLFMPHGTSRYNCQCSSFTFDCVFVCVCLHRVLTKLVSWCFQPSQPQRIISGLVLSKQAYTDMITGFISDREGEDAIARQQIVFVYSWRACSKQETSNSSPWQGLNNWQQSSSRYSKITM